MDNREASRYLQILWHGPWKGRQEVAQARRGLPELATDSNVKEERGGAKKNQLRYRNSGPELPGILT